MARPAIRRTTRRWRSSSTTPRTPRARRWPSRSSAPRGGRKSGGTAAVRTVTKNNRADATARRRSQVGFTMIEMVVAMMVLMVGLLALASAVGYAINVTNSGRGVTNTKLLVVSVLEQMENLRNTGELSFGQIANAGAVDNTGAATN